VSISQRLRQDADPIWQGIIEHPFVVELYEGTLPMEKFKSYILQDYNYLVSLIEVLSIIASRATSLDAMREVVEILRLELDSELKGYEEFLKRLGCSRQEAMAIDPLPMNLSYTSFLLSTSSLKPYAESITSILPCFWSYAEIAAHHQGKLRGNGNRLLVEWAEVYLSEAYLDLVERVKRLVDEAGEGFPYERLLETFSMASRYEYTYWEAMYNMETWPL